MIKRAFTYGSRARGDHAADSDLDVAIEIVALPNDSDAFTTYIFEKDRLAQSLSSRLSVDLHLEFLDGDKTPIVALAVENDGLLVFDGDDYGSDPRALSRAG